MKVKLELSNYTTKADLKNATGADTSAFAKAIDFANLNFDVDKLDNDKLKNVPSGSGSLKSKVDKLNIGESETTPVDISKLSDVVKNKVVKKTDNVKINAKIKDIEDKIPDIKISDSPNTKINEVNGKIPSITNLATNAVLYAKINKVKCKIPGVTNLDITTALADVENKIPIVSNLGKKR